MIKRLFSELNRIIPKKNTIIFTSFPAFHDNAFALYKYIAENRKDIVEEYEIIWAQNKHEIKEAEKYNIKKTVVKKSLKGIWFFLRAKYIISTHDYFSDVKAGNGQIQINLWHGNGYKKIPTNHIKYRGDYSISTSGFFKAIVADKIMISDDKVWVTGLPRNDELFHKKRVLNKIVSRKFKKTIMWLPTYRDSYINNNQDGNSNILGLATFIDNCYEKMNVMLSELDYLLIIKPHPMDVLSLRDRKNSGNIMFINDSLLDEQRISLYNLLNEVDILVSDYSSITIDFLLLNKPICIFCPDIEEYQKNRGFVMNPIVDFLPGPIIKDYKELSDYIANYTEYDKQWKRKREELRDLFHLYHDDRSSKRVCDRIFNGNDV